MSTKIYVLEKNSNSWREIKKEEIEANIKGDYVKHNYHEIKELSKLENILIAKEVLFLGKIRFQDFAIKGRIFKSDTFKKFPKFLYEMKPEGIYVYAYPDLEWRLVKCVEDLQWYSYDKPTLIHSEISTLKGVYIVRYFIKSGKNNYYSFYIKGEWLRYPLLIKTP